MLDNKDRLPGEDPQRAAAVCDAPPLAVRGTGRAARLLDIIEDARQTFGLGSVTVLVGAPLAAADIAHLLRGADVTSIVVQTPVPPESRDPARIGTFDAAANAWVLPDRLGQTLVVIEVPRYRPTFFMAAAAMRRGMTSYVVRDLLQFERRRFARAAVQRVGRRAGLMTLDLLRTIQVRGATPGRRLYRALNIGGLPDKAVRALTWVSERKAARNAMSRELALPIAPILPRDAFVPGRVLMVNSALAWGGAERQLVNTMLGLAERGYDVALACESLGRVPDSEFFAWRLERGEIEVASMRRAVDAFRTDGHLPATLSEDLIDALSAQTQRLPEPLRETVIPYALEILARRPQIVHAWQDQTCVATGVAAVITGVPAIVLSTRNVSPPNFAYFQPHMRETYRALARVPHVRIMNNSDAGRDDYCRWLGLPRSAIARLHNGLDFDSMQPLPATDVAAFRKELGISTGHKVVGSIFRLYPEKDPLLWLDMAERVARARQDVSFLVIGVGPMRDELMARAAAGPLGPRLLMPGTLQHPERALALMDVFVLTSRFEGLPNVVIEAQACGLPVVATPAGGTGEAFAPGTTGWLVERDAAQLADRVLATLADRAWASDARARAPALMRERFGLSRMIDETIALYQSVGV